MVAVASLTSELFDSDPGMLREDELCECMKVIGIPDSRVGAKFYDQHWLNL